MLNRNNKIEIDVSEFSARDTLKETMEYYAITQSELANRIGVSQAYISDILKRKKFMSSEVALKIEKATGIPAMFLLKMDSTYQLDQLEKKNFDELDNIHPFEWAIV
ncbi:HigA family addiction module antitoxin [Lactococcus garvieae]|uniref:HigA family addiction module antitoxin n=1 Tax=Lactococcus garvieae TaxID=1363 RepID=UPI003854220A